jgi:hypothetical protein
VSIRGVLMGALGLAVLQLVISNPERADRVGALGGIASGLIARFLSPAIAAIPDRRSSATTPPPASTLGTPPAPSDVAAANSTYNPRLPVPGHPAPI